MLLFRLIFEFFKAGLFAVGGASCHYTFPDEEMGNNFGWFDVHTLTTMIAVSESTPGPMGINMATYVGYHTYGIVGGVITSLSLVVPSIIIVCTIASMYDQFKKSKTVQAVFSGLRPAVVGFIISACMGIFMTTLLNLDVYEVTGNLVNLVDYFSVFMVVVLLVINHYRKLNPIYTIVFCGVVGVLLQL